MSDRPPPLRRGPAERVAAWLVTGPLGHLWSVLVDVATFGGRWLARRLTHRS